MNPILDRTTAAKCILSPIHFLKLARNKHLLLCLAMLLDLQCSAGTVRHYYIAAEDVTWDFAPSDRDLISNRELPQNIRLIGTKWKKTKYVEYTDDSFTQRKPQPAWIGILGPVIRAEVGDIVIVDFFNKSAKPHNIHPHGLKYDKDSEGALYLPFGSGARVLPGQKFRYRWIADRTSGPLPTGPSSVVWVYHPHDDEPAETNAGMIGPIIVTAAGKAREDASPNDVDREFVALFMIFDQLQGKPEGLFYTINGYSFGNLPGLVMNNGERVRWHLLGMGDEDDLHTPHWHGNTVADGSRYTDVIELLPASMVTVDMQPENLGTWLFHCQVAEHMEQGMMATYTVHQPARACPTALRPDFWSTSDRFRVQVTNQDQRTISAVHLRVEYFVLSAANDRGFEDEWTWQTAIPPGGQQAFELQDYFRQKGLTGYFTDDSIIGWAVYPTKIEYRDGTTWTPRERGECFALSWRHGSPPVLEALPPLQPDTELPEDFPRPPSALRKRR